jgi:vancomycin permeability regulator SanA
LELLHKGLVPHVFFDAEERSLIYDELLVDIAQRYINARGEQSRVSVCPVTGSSTFAEVRDANRCLQTIGAHSVLIVTSEFHTRRALMIFRHSLPQYQFHVAAARNSWQFGEKWWTNREWAKTVFDEWLKTAWWEAVDRWRT